MVSQFEVPTYCVTDKELQTDSLGKLERRLDKRASAMQKFWERERSECVTW